MGRFVPINVTTNVLEKRAPKFTGAKVYYDGKQCWQYKAVYDRPGTYTFNVPSGAICARTVIVGGGGKPKCISVNFDGSTCNSAAGAGGGYSDKCHAVTGGSTSFTITVGRQEATSSVSCNGTPVHSASGASGMIPGTATGGDWNSTGGCAGWTCNNCGGSYSHYCGSCKYLCFATCCGYCIVYQYSDAGTGGVPCCNLLLAGGGSAGSPFHLCGGTASTVCGWNGSTAGVGGGGAGIGNIYGRPPIHYSCCTCICPFYSGNNNDGNALLTFDWPTTAQGGGGSKVYCDQCCRSWQGECIAGIWRGLDGGPGGPNIEETEGWTFEWGYADMCQYPFGGQCYKHCYCERGLCSPCICKVNWWEPEDICGSGSPGWLASRNRCSLCFGFSHGQRPRNAGEGAGTGAIYTFCCSSSQIGNMIGMTNGSSGPQVNWQLLCTLGVCGWCDQAYHMVDALFPFFVTCAGTLGGSGGVNWCGYTSKAGFGGGGGQSKCQLLCVCYGGSYNLCNGTGAALAFPPSQLDHMISNAGTGLAIVYYREA